jgi:hypothetical protein
VCWRGIPHHHYRPFGFSPARCSGTTPRVLLIYCLTHGLSPCAQLTGAAVVPAATTAPGGQTTQLPNGQTAAKNPNNALALTGPNAAGANAGASKVRTESAAQIAAANPQSNVFNSDVKTAASNPGG